MCLGSSRKYCKRNIKIMAKAIYRIYRPTTFKEVSGQEHVVRTIQNQYASESLAHAYLFTGPRGVGKTTIARLMAKLVNCQSPKGSESCNTCDACLQMATGKALDVYEIDAASHTQVEHVREGVINSVRFAPNQLNKKVYIIDEVHMLSASAFNALLKTLEEPPEYALFILATTEIHKVPDTIISRCQRFDFRRIEADELVKRLEGIVKLEGVDVEKAVLREIVRHSDGCARDAESLLGQVLALGEKKIGLKEASLVLPVSNDVQVQTLIDALMARETKKGIELLNETLDQGMDLKHFVSDVISGLRDRLMASLTEASEPSVLVQYAIDEFINARNRIRLSHIPQLPVELAIVKICTGTGWVKPPSDFNQQEVGSGRVSPSQKEDQASVKVETKKDVSVSEDTDQLIESSSGKSETKKATQSVVSETVFDSVPVINIEDVKKKWPQVYDQIKQCNASLPLMMKQCEVSGVEGERVELSFDFDLYVDTVNKEKNRTLIEGVLEQVLGKKLRIRAVASKKSQSDEVVNGLLQEFGGSVV
jgi:DNA polymerase III subunit gamma/tau